MRLECWNISAEYWMSGLPNVRKVWGLQDLHEGARFDISDVSM